MKLTGNAEAFVHTLRLGFKINRVSTEETTIFIIIYHKHHKEKQLRRKKGVQQHNK